MAKNLIFVSCGQATEPEKTLGEQVKTVIDATPGFEAYFAETVQDLDALGCNVFDALRRSAGAVVVLHDRGLVTSPDGNEWGRRSSVWINQELAILAYRQFAEARRIPALAFADPKVRLEGAMTSLIVNPRAPNSTQEVAPAVSTWLANNNFASVSDEAFQRKWEQLSERTRQVVAALLGEGGHAVKEAAVRRTLMHCFDTGSNDAAEAVRNAKLEFISTDLVKLVDNIHSGDELSVHPTWDFALRREIARWLAARSSSA